jgi:hypothetical protein
MSSIGVPVVSRKEKRLVPLKTLDPWIQSDAERAICLETLAARDSSKATGIFCKVGPELAILVTTMLITSESSASFATAEFYPAGAATPEHHVKLDPKIMFESMVTRIEGRNRARKNAAYKQQRQITNQNQKQQQEEEEGEHALVDFDEGGMAFIGCPKASAPKFEVKGGKRGVFISLPPIELCTNPGQYPKVGETVALVAHPYGHAKIRVGLFVSSIDIIAGTLTLEPPAPDGCNGSPILYNGKCIAIIHQPRIGPLATEAMLMHMVLAVAYHDSNLRLGAMGGSLGSSHVGGRGQASTFRASPIYDINPELNNFSVREVEKAEAEVLVKAVRQGNLETVLKLQNEIGIELLRDWKDFNGRSLVHFAAFYKNSISLSGLMREGYDLESETKAGDTPVHIACYQGAVECLKLLNIWGCSLTAPNANGETPSHKAAMRGNIDILAYLHNEGVKITYPQNKQGLSPLALAEESGT